LTLGVVAAFEIRLLGTDAKFVQKSLEIFQMPKRISTAETEAKL
jgi:hypothetical protein